MVAVSAYLNFGGNCEEAFEHYRSVFGGEFTVLSRFGEAPAGNGPPTDPDQILHITLDVGDGFVIMGSDRPATMGPVTVGDNVQISVNPSDGEQARAIFDGLASGGTVTMPYQPQFWGADFGMCIDRFGVHWMVNHEHAADA